MAFLLSSSSMGVLLLCLYISTASGFVSQTIPPNIHKGSRWFLDGEGMAGGTRHLLGDIFRSLQPRYLSQVASSLAGNAKGSKPINLDGMVNDMPSWEELAQELYQQQTPQERNFRTLLEQGQGPPSALATKRLFGEKKARVIFYRDSASWCPYCQKVWIALEEKTVPYEIVKIDMRCYGSGKPSEFMKLQPNGNLPCAVIAGKVVSESDDIVDVIDSIGASADTPKLRRCQEQLTPLCDDGKYNSLERRLYSRWMWWLTGKRKPQEYKQVYLEHLDEVEQALAENTEGPFFLGKDLSLADIRFIPFVERQIATLAYFKGYNIRDPELRPNLCAWLDAMEKRPSYQATKSDYYTHSHAMPPQLSADCQFEAGCEAFRDKIDALPVGNKDEWSEPGWDLKDPAKARREAVERLVYGHEKIVRFSCRAAGTPGIPASAAPLADPRATSNTDAVPAVDLALRHVAFSLLFPSKPASALTGMDKDTTEAIADCLCYLRARIGVPRDMSYPAAQELRRELRRLSSELRSLQMFLNQKKRALV